MLGYHYCSVENFLNILKNKQIYLSDPLKMNDSSEIVWFIEQLEKEEYISEYISIFEEIKIRTGINFTLEDLKKEIDSNGQDCIYIACFSSVPDLLSQWRSYGGDGAGVSVGFDLAKLKLANNFFVEPVVYIERNLQSEEIVNVADTIQTVIRENNISDKEGKIKVLINELLPILAKYKNPSFSEEQELRLIYCEQMMFDEILEKYGAYTEPFKTEKIEHDFRAIGANNATEFIKMNFEPSAIKEIYIGPKCQLKESDIKNIMNKLLKIRVDIKKSKSTFR